MFGHHHSLSLDTRDSLVRLKLASNNPFAKTHLFSRATAMVNILSKNDSAQNICTGYSIDKIRKFHSKIKAHSKAIQDVLLVKNPCFFGK
jgi:hypothetical protein